METTTRFFTIRTAWTSLSARRNSRKAGGTCPNGFSAPRARRCLPIAARLESGAMNPGSGKRSEEHTSELQSRGHLVCRLLLEKKKTKIKTNNQHKNTTHK